MLLAGPILSLLGAHSSVSALSLLVTLALVVALPLAVGCAVRTIDPFGGRERSLISVLGVLSLLVLLWLVASQLRLHASDGLVAVALVVFLAGSSVLGWLLSRGAPGPRRTALLLPTAMRDFAVAAGIAASAFGAAAAAPLGIYGVLVLVFGAVTVYRVQAPPGHVAALPGRLDGAAVVVLAHERDRPGVAAPRRGWPGRPGRFRSGPGPRRRPARPARSRRAAQASVSVGSTSASSAGRPNSGHRSQRDSQGTGGGLRRSR